MIYKAKEGSKAYEYIKDICKKEHEERKAFMGRVERMIGFKIGKFSGYSPNKRLDRKYIITALLVDDSTYESLDKKIWNQKGIINGLHKVVPIKRTKEGKEIAAAFTSCKSITTHWDILKELNVTEPNNSHFAITQLLCNFSNKTYMVYIDNSIRADKDNPDLIEITMSEYDKLMEC